MKEIQSFQLKGYLFLIGEKVKTFTCRSISEAKEHSNDLMLARIYGARVSCFIDHLCVIFCVLFNDGLTT